MNNSINVKFIKVKFTPLVILRIVDLVSLCENSCGFIFENL